MVDGELLIFWTVRLALAAYALVLLGWLCGWQGTEWRPTAWQRAARVLWTVGCGLFLGHVFCAFQFHHHWDHGHAYAETGRRTAAMFGLDWGGGIYVNHLFTLVWVLDAVWWWSKPQGYLARSPAVTGVLHGWFLFIAINGAIVFATPPMRYASLGLLALVAAAWAWTKFTARDAASEPCKTM